uniref:Phenoloxidase-activating factor 2 n=2 Tax=Cacopsylla melanoneura TaxID=428564 RepID=A0A8D9DQA6_9HEMI
MNKVMGEEPEVVEECGIRKGSSNNYDLRITAPNSETQFGEFPWMMAILTTKINEDGSVQDNVFQCGASLIQPNVVLTAAHCVYNLRPEDIKVRAGEWDTISNEDPLVEPYPDQEETVSEVLFHDGFELATVYNDIALLILKHPIKLRTHIGLVCTPNFVDEYDPESCVVTGWGKEQFGKTGQYQSKLRFLDLKVVERQSCQNQLRQTRLGNYFRLHDSFLCAIGDRNKDACKGDGGGPLVCRLRSDPQRYTQVGIVAWGIGCGGGSPGVYVDVYKFKRWILNNSKGNRVHTRIVQ